MPKSALSISLPSPPNEASDGLPSSISSDSPQSAPLSSPSHGAGASGDGMHGTYKPGSPRRSSFTAPQTPISPRHHREPSKSLFSNVKASKSSSRIFPTDNSIRQVSDSNRSGSNPHKVYSNRKSGGSTPELGSLPLNTSSANITAIPSYQPNNSTVTVTGNYNEAAVAKKGAGKRFPQILRTQSIRDQDTVKLSKPKPAPGRVPTSGRVGDSSTSNSMQSHEALGMRTAPLEKERSFREMMSSTLRNRSADRHNIALDSEDDGLGQNKERSGTFLISSSLKDGHGGSLLSNIKHGSSRAADGIGKAGKGIFGKFTRSGSSHERDIPTPRVEEEYSCKVINLPLVQQTRLTRISKRLADSKDKTEFWMPALPWRCIDYLNMKGCEEEGLYRVPGSGREIKQWQMRFDSELDINLFEQTELYDINIIGSMFKAWLRELPDEILPKATQNRIAEAVEKPPPAEAPQVFKDELSKLPPFNYYLLFAITCHISLLHSCSDMNKMDYRNLCICFQPCMKIDGMCFQWLVLDWRNCWQGCWTEKEYLSEELRIMGQMSGPKDGRAVSVSQFDRSRHASKERSLSKDRSKVASRGDRGSPAGNGDRAKNTSNAMRSLPASNIEVAAPPSKHERAAARSHGVVEDRALSSSDSGSTKRSAQSSANTSEKVRTPDKPRPPPLMVARTRQQAEYSDMSAPNSAITDNAELPSLSPMRPLSPIGPI